MISFSPWRTGGRSKGGTGKPFLTTCFCHSHPCVFGWNRLSLPSPSSQHLLLLRPLHFTSHPKTSLIAFYTHAIVYKCFPCPYDSKNMPHGTIRACLPIATPHCAESGSAGQTGSPNREPRAPNPEFRAPGSTPTTPAWLWAPYAHFGQLEAAPSPTQGTQNDPPF